MNHDVCQAKHLGKVPYAHRALARITQLISLEVLIAFLHLALTAGVVFGVIHSQGGGE